MRSYVGITDWEWFQLLSAQPNLPEANFWQPGGNRQFRALDPGELFLFKLHSPRNFIVGGGVFAHASILPVGLAWDAFGLANGASTLADMRSRIESYRRSAGDRGVEYRIGCIILTQPFFLPESLWIPVPSDWRASTQVGKRYDLAAGPGAVLFQQLQAALAAMGVGGLTEVRDHPELPTERFGRPTLVRPRLGQGAFRVLVTDAYERRCSITGEKVLPVLEAAHIRPYAEGGPHDLENGLLLRSDLHALFDQGYMTVTPERRVEVSRRIREEFENGRTYYALHGEPVRAPSRPLAGPAPPHLVWHNENVYKG